MTGTASPEKGFARKHPPTGVLEEQHLVHGAAATGTARSRQLELVPGVVGHVEVNFTAKSDPRHWRGQLPLLQASAGPPWLAGRAYPAAVGEVVEALQDQAQEIRREV